MPKMLAAQDRRMDSLSSGLTQERINNTDE